MELTHAPLELKPVRQPHPPRRRWVPRLLGVGLMGLVILGVVGTRSEADAPRETRTVQPPPGTGGTGAMAGDIRSAPGALGAEARFGDAPSAETLVVEGGAEPVVGRSEAPDTRAPLVGRERPSVPGHELDQRAPGEALRAQPSPLETQRAVPLPTDRLPTDRLPTDRLPTDRLLPERDTAPDGTVDGRTDAATGDPLQRGPACGGVICESGQVCCNASCGICAAPGQACSQRICGTESLPISVPCGPNTCNVGDVCCNPSCGTCVRPGQTCDDRNCGREVVVPTNISCGMSLCNTGMVCCNPSCGICVRPGESCSDRQCR